MSARVEISPGPDGAPRRAAGGRRGFAAYLALPVIAATALLVALYFGLSFKTALLYGTDEQRPATKADLAAAAQALRDALANLPPVPVEVPELTMTLSGTAKAAEPS